MMSRRQSRVRRVSGSTVEWIVPAARPHAVVSASPTLQTGPLCGHAMRLIALIERADVIRRILRHLGELTEVPAPAAARAPPLFAASDQGLAGDETPGLAYDREPPPDYDEPC